MKLILPTGQHFGTVTQQWRSTDMIVSEVRYEPHIETPPHANEQALLVFVNEGGYAKEVDGSTELACSGDHFLFVPAKRIQTDLFGAKETTCLIVDCSQSLLQKAGETGAEIRQAAVLCGVEFASCGVKLKKELKNTDAASQLVFEGLLLYALASAFRAYRTAVGPKIPSWLLEARELLRERFSEDIRMEAVAAEVGVHPVHLSREFRRFFRKTPGSYLRGIRVEFASRQLVDTSLPLLEIAMGAGFADQAHFSRTFRELTDLTPSEYRRLHRIC